MRSQDEFWLIADVAIARGLLTRDEADVICRRGSRKERYWARHVENLKKILKRRVRIVEV